MDTVRGPLELPPEALRRATSPADLGFETTHDLPTPQRMVGQERAQEAIELALEVTDPRYNLYVAGDPGVGRTTAVLNAVEQVARTRPATSDWVYVHHFEQPEEPLALRLPPGRGRVFAHDVEQFVLGSRRELRRAFSADVYDEQRAALVADIETQHSKLLDNLQQRALDLGFVIRGTPSGLAILPVKVKEGERLSADHADDVETLPQEEFNALPDETRQLLLANRDQVQTLIGQTLPQVRGLEEEARRRVRALDQTVADAAVGHLAEGISASYDEFSDVAEFLRRLRVDLVAHADVLRGANEENATDDESKGGGDGSPTRQGASEPTTNSLDSSADEGEVANNADEGADDADGATMGGVPLDEDLRDRPALAALLRRYRVNALVAYKADDTAPVVQEINPTYVNLTGRIEFGVRDGLPYTDHMMIKAGAFHRAAGGFLVVQARDLLSASRSWDAVKRLLRFGKITTESGLDSPTAPPSATLRPQPIPAAVKIVLIGDRETYVALLEVDPEFRQLFKVRADFDVEMPRTPETERAYAHVIGATARATSSPPLAADGVALLIEEGSRWAEDQRKLSTQFTSVSDLTVEACYWAKKAGATITTRAHVTQAIQARERRFGLLSDKMDELIRDGVVMIDTDGEAVGQVNGLSVLTVSDHSFGKPTRITSRVSPGLTGILNIERETAQSGPSHTKGVLILGGYLAGRYAQDFPLSLTASLCFEQMYSEVEGDSASSTELYALLSALANVPIRQSLAVTGSVNQRGEVQAIGGATYKIEGFFAVCKQRPGGLTGRQGVIIPKANAINLMLREEVVEAVRAGLFHIYAINTIDEGIELLTGLPSGHPDRAGRYLEGTIGARVSQRLREYSDKVRAYGLAAAFIGHGLG
ncbi:MAG: ATP-binding protein [Ktedonobacterales bacterium]